MIKMIFTLTYQQQLRQTQFDVFHSVEDSIIALIESCGGNVQAEHKYLIASFDDQTIAFWLDIVIFIEKLDQILKQFSDELYGHACLIAPENAYPENFSGMLRELASLGNYSGIWLAQDISVHLHPYFYLDDNPSFSFLTKNHFDVIQIKQAKNIYGLSNNENIGYPLRNHIMEVLGQQANFPYIVLAGPKFIGLKDGLHHFYKKQWQDNPPLIFRFGSGGKGLSCIVDAFSPEIKNFFEENCTSNRMNFELEKVKNFIACERLRSEYSALVKEKAGYFLTLLFDSYIKVSRMLNVDPFIIIENIEEIDETAHHLIIQKIADLRHESGISVYGTSNSENNLDAWQSLNFKIIVFSLPGGMAAETSSGKNLSRDMKELWEIAYMCYLMRPFFPGYALLSLFNKEGKDSAVMERAFEILNVLGVITSPQDPEPVMIDFAEKARTVLGEERIRIIKEMVRNRLLDWVRQGKLLPCFHLLTALVQLEGDCSDDLMLDAMYQDIIDGVYSGLHHSIDSGDFLLTAGNVRNASLTYIFHTFSALVHGNEECIHETFLADPPENIPTPRYESYIASNLASYELSVRNEEKAAIFVKKAMLAAQNIKSRGGARAFRLYALVNIMQGNMPDAIEYLQFAADHAERSKDWEELSVISYYSSVVHFLFGNISKAERLADHAEAEALKCGMASWSAKSRFFKGRILFEQGKYAEAYDVFRSIVSKSENEDTLDAWKYRSKTFLGENSSIIIKNDGDSALFLIEAAYIQKNYEKVIDLADQLLVNLPNHTFVYIEQADWQSGFSQTELLLFSQKDFLHRLVSTYRALALSQQTTNPSSALGAAAIMQQITRDEKFPDTDMNDAFYYFAQYQVFQNTNASLIDLNTAVSIAFKRLQRRASRIDDIETKRSFLLRNKWNSALYEAAKRHKLI